MAFPIFMQLPYDIGFFLVTTIFINERNINDGNFLQIKIKRYIMTSLQISLISLLLLITTD